MEYIAKLITTKGGISFLLDAVIIGVASYSLITAGPVIFHMDQPINYTFMLSEWAGYFLVVNAVFGCLLAGSILPGLKSPLIECPKCKKPGAFVKSATYHCETCGDVTPIGKPANQKKSK